MGADLNSSNAHETFGAVDEDFESSGPKTLPPLREFRIRWSVVIVYLLVHAGAIAAFWHFEWASFWVALLLLNCSGCFGISVGYHRLLAHDAFQTYRWVRWFHALWGVLSLQLGPITWVRLHKIHHARADTAEDPHPQIFGYWFGYIGWVLLSHRSIGRSPLAKQIKLAELSSDPVMQALDKYSFFIFLFSLVVLYAIGGWSLLLWAGCLRVVVLTHLTWTVNVWSHRWGKKPFPTRDLSRNNPVTGLLGWGEGWHNNHHYFPSSAAFGLRWYQIDFGWWWIRALSFVGLAWNLKTPSAFAPPPVGPTNKY